MLFNLLKIYARVAIKIFCRRIIVNYPHWLQAQGPLLLACNHPNSFLDGIILTVLFQQPVYSLTRGDAFRNKRHEKILRWLHLLPVYRTSEGVENLEHNYTTFDTCKEIFEQKGIVIIFSEGRCINEWHLRPLKKGTARLATSAWLQGIDLTVLPVGFNYNSFRHFGKNVFVNLGQPLDKEAVLEHASDGKMFLSFNEQLQEALQPLVYEIDSNDKAALRQHLEIKQPLWKQMLLVLPALIGVIIHAPFYFPVKWMNAKYFDNDHFDSTMVGFLALGYPLYLLLLCVAGWITAGWLAAVILFFFAPFSAWSVVQLKPQI